METYYKAVRPDGTDFHSGTVQWIPKDGKIPDGGWVVTHPLGKNPDHPYLTLTEGRALGNQSAASKYLSVATDPEHCTGMRWPCRLLRVAPTEQEVTVPEPVDLPFKRASSEWRVVEELPAPWTLGPQGEAVLEFFSVVQEIPLGTMDALVRAVKGSELISFGGEQYKKHFSAYNNAYRHAHETREKAWYICKTILQQHLPTPHVEFGVDTRMYREAVNVITDVAVAILMQDKLTEEEYEILCRTWNEVVGVLVKPRSSALATSANRAHPWVSAWW